MKRTLILVFLACLLLSASPRHPAACAAAGSAGSVRLVLVIVVDQMRADYLSRFEDQFRGGLRHLMLKGRIFAEAHQEHACTVTAVGHSTILTGSLPAHNGIIGNDWYDRSRKQVVHSTTAVNGTEVGHSGDIPPAPLALRTTALGDWIRESNPEARVFALSRKDRAAIMLGGQHPTGVFWYNPAGGTFQTSAYYQSGLPGWLSAFNASKPANKYFRRVWDRMTSASHYGSSTPDDQPGEKKLNGRRTFPYRYDAGSRPDSRFYSYLTNTPFMDELTLELAERAVRAEKLGQRGVPDLLAVSLSTTDSVGHNFGPRSQEIQDMMLRLDRMLDRFLKFVDRQVGLDEVLIVLTGDHGVAALPETENSDGLKLRASGGLDETIKGAEAALELAYGPGPWIEREYDGNVYLNRTRMQEAGISYYDIERRAAEALRCMPLVENVFTRTELSSGNLDGGGYAALFANCYDPVRSGDLLIQVRRDTLLLSDAGGTTHGSPYQFDTHVPLVFCGPGVLPGRDQSHVRTVDIAPTLAGILGVSINKAVDGVPLKLR